MNNYKPTMNRGVNQTRAADTTRTRTANPTATTNPTITPYTAPTVPPRTYNHVKTKDYYSTGMGDNFHQPQRPGSDLKHIKSRGV